MPRTRLAIYKTCGASGDGSLMYEPSAGDSVTDTCEVIAAIASETAESVTACFNGIELCANPGVSPQSIVEFYTNECERLYRIYLAVTDAEQMRSSLGGPTFSPRSCSGDM